jgi:glycosyltransferase involved in cell wall biosynthesis
MWSGSHGRLASTPRELTGAAASRDDQSRTQEPPTVATGGSVTRVPIRQASHRRRTAVQCIVGREFAGIGAPRPEDCEGAIETMGAEIDGEMASGTEIRAAFVLEQHLGHRTYAENLRLGVGSASDLDAQWIPVRYAKPGGFLERRMLPASLQAYRAGRAEVRHGLNGAGDVDVVVFNTQVPAALGGRRARTAPFVVITDVTPIQYDRMSEGYGHRVDRNGPVRWYKHRENTRVFRSAAFCVGWSSWAASSITDDYGVASDRVAVIPPGVDLDRWSPGSVNRDGPLRLLFVGGEFERKGGPELLEAFAELPESAELTIVTKSKVPGLERVTVVDDLSPNDPRLVELFRSSNAFVLPSRSETFGIAAVEAAAAGLPVVASSVGGLADIVVDGGTGLLIEPGNTAHLKRALTMLEADPSLRRRLGAAARVKAVEHFDSQANVEKLLQLIRRAADVRSRSQTRSQHRRAGVQRRGVPRRDDAVRVEPDIHRPGGGCFRQRIDRRYPSSPGEVRPGRPPREGAPSQ